MYEDVEVRYENTVSGVFLRRLNRFTAQVVVSGREETVHVKNTGRLGELLVPQAQVTLQRVNQPGRKTAYDLISVYRPGSGWVNIDSLAPNALVHQWLQAFGYDLIRPEYTYGESRIDFYMEQHGEKFLTEVKGCTLADSQHPGIGLFPDAPTERGVKHLHELAHAVKDGYHCSLLFVIQMNGIHSVLPNGAAQPEFQEALEAAQAAGVQVNCLRCRVAADRISVDTQVVMDLHHPEQVIFMNMCMVCDGQGNIVALDKVGRNYSGITFPGGHVEPGESFADAAVREVQEETGLTIRDPRLMGIYHWYRGAVHNVGYLYRSEHFTGTLKDSEEGHVFWISQEAYAAKKLARGMDKVLQIMNGEGFSECCFRDGVEKMY